MVADAAFSMPPARREPMDDSTPAVNVVVVGSGADLGLVVAAALLDEGLRVDALAATATARALLARLLPPERLRLESPAPLVRVDAARWVARRFAAQPHDQEALHARLRHALLARLPPPPPSTRLSSSPSPPSGLTALVPVRREGVSGRRLMSPCNLQRVLAALAQVSRRAAMRRERITHVLLHGWLPPDELRALQSEHGHWLRLDRLSGGLPGDEAVTAAQLLPELAALQQRHRDALVAVGFVAPLLTGCALVGIPAFVLDEAAATRWRQCHADGRYLVDARRDDQAPALGRDVDTFIPIAVRLRDREGPAEIDRPALADLMTALRVWTARGLSGGQRLWGRRTLLCRSGLALVRFTTVRQQCEADAGQLT